MTTLKPPPKTTAAKPPQLVKLALVCIGASLLCHTVTYFADEVPITNRSRTQAVEFVRSYLGPAAWILAALGVLLAIAHVLWGLHHKKQTQLASTLAVHLRIPGDILHCKATYTRGRIISGWVRYPKKVALPVDPVHAVVKALNPLAAGPLVAEHTPRNRTVTWRLAPPEVPSNWWDDIPLLVSVYTNLSPLLAGLDIDRETTVVADSDTTSITLRYGTTSKDVSPNFRQRVQKILTNKAPSPTGAWALVWLPHEHKLVLRPGVPLPSNALVPAVKDLPAPATMAERSLPIGVRRGGNLGFWNPLKFPHLLVAGPTGGGKSSLIRTVLSMALIYEWDAYLLDPKLLGYRLAFGTGWGLGHDRIATRGDTMEAIVLAFHKETERRYRLCEWGLAKPDMFHTCVLIVDENTEAIPAMNRAAYERWLDTSPEDRPNRPPKESPAVEALWSIARLGRQVGMYVVLAHQRPDVTYIPGEARDNLLSSYACGPISEQAAKMLFDQYGVDQRVMEPRAGEDGEIVYVPVTGRATVNLGLGIEPLQGFWTPDPANPKECPPGSLEEARMAELAAAARAGQERANHQLLDGVITIDPQREEELAAQELTAREREQWGLTIEGDSVPGGDDDAPADSQPANQAPAGGATQGPGGNSTLQGQPPGGAMSPDQAGPASDEDSEFQELLRLAAELLVSSQYGSVSMLQRKLRVGHQKASTLMTELESLGIVGPSAGTKARNVIAKPGDDLAAILAEEPEAPEIVVTPRFDQVDVSELEDDDLVRLDLDGEQVLVVVEHAEDLEDDSLRVEVDYRIVDPGHPHAGQGGSIELDARDSIERQI